MASVSGKNKVTVSEEETTQSASDVEPSCGQVNFEANFGRLSLKMLKFLCQGMGISDAGLKQELVGRLVNEYKKKEESSGELFVKGKAVNIDNEMGDIESFPSARDYGHMAGGGKGSRQIVINKKPKVGHDRSQKFEDEKSSYQGCIPSLQQGQPIAPVFLQAHLSMMPAWQQVPNLQNAAVTAPGFVFGGINPFGARQA
ncbi:17929_t:CDS:2 [Cetraspora pellucida]|uniref:17929_t:CDS:1 n=1 Tax=Cetraspora pellucida TaxID=1433469 RepID=A0A9N9GZM1_9GLOM|nr:17929_t:CDS:2 [Cetraspora pellucida]